jgi:Helix-turn-helix domain
MNIQSTETKANLSQLGVAPTVKEVADFFKRDVVTIYRHLYRGDFEVVLGFGVARISIGSIERFLNRTGPYRPRKLTRKIKESTGAI